MERIKVKIANWGFWASVVLSLGSDWLEFVTGDRDFLFYGREIRMEVVKGSLNGEYFVPFRAPGVKVNFSSSVVNADHLCQSPLAMAVLHVQKSSRDYEFLSEAFVEFNKTLTCIFEETLSFFKAFSCF